MVEFPCEFHNELRASVRNHLSQKLVQFPDMCKEQVAAPRAVIVVCVRMKWDILLMESTTFMIIS